MLRVNYLLENGRMNNLGKTNTQQKLLIQGYNSSLTMLGGGSSGGAGIQNDNTTLNQFQIILMISPQASTNDMDDEIPF